MGFVTKNSVDPNVFSEAAKLQAGEISVPTKSPFGYHLVKVTELVPTSVKPYESVRADLEKTAQQTAAESRFYELSQILAEQGFEHPDSLDSAAASVGVTPQVSELFSRSEGTGIAAEEAFRKAAFSQDVLDGKNSEPVELADGEKAVLLHLKEHVAATPIPLDEVRPKITAILKEQAARDAVTKRAQDLIKSLQTDRTMADLAKAEKIELTKSEFFKRNGDKLDRPLVNAAFKIRSADKQEAFSLVALENGDQAIIHLLSIKEGDAAADSKDMEMAREFLERNAGQNEMASYLAELRDEGNVHERPTKP